MVIDEDVYIINVGDSRAVVSRNGGKEFGNLTTDHKPMEIGEYTRITTNGGKIY